MSLSPFIRTPLTDLTSCVVNHQQYDKCGQREILMLECLEAYGMDMGAKKCKLLMEDFQECVGMRKQLARVEVILVIQINSTIGERVLFMYIVVVSL